MFEFAFSLAWYVPTTTLAFRAYLWVGFGTLARSPSVVASFTQKSIDLNSCHESPSQGGSLNRESLRSCLKT